MKKFRKIMAVLVAAMMIMATMVPAWADPAPTNYGSIPNTKGTITIDNAAVAQTYTIYEILTLASFNDAHPATNLHVDDAYAYVLKAGGEWVDFFTDDDYEGSKYFEVDTLNPVTLEGISGNWYVVTPRTSISGGGTNLVNPFQDTTGSKDETTDAQFKSNALVQAFAQKALLYAKSNKVTGNQGQKTADSTTVAFTNLELGYYLVDSSAGALCALDTTNKDAVMKEKNDVPDSKKYVQEDRGVVAGNLANNVTAYQHINDATIGDVVYYQSVIDVKKGAENYVFHDTMDAGLSYRNDAVVYYIPTGVDITSASSKSSWKELTDKQDIVIGDNHYTTPTHDTASKIEIGDFYSTSPTATGDNFTITFTDSFTTWLSDQITNAGENPDNYRFLVSYSATLTDKAKIGTANLNTSWLTYGDSKSTTPSITHTYTWPAEIFKYTGDIANNPTGLRGAKFELWATEATTGENAGRQYKFVKLKSGDVGYSSSEEVYRVVPDGTSATISLDLTGATTESPQSYDVVDSITTDGTGKFIVQGLDEGEYFIHEITAPYGYNKLAYPVRITVSSSITSSMDVPTVPTETVTYNSKVKTSAEGDPAYGSEVNISTTSNMVAILNKTTTELPSTGGMGTTVLYIVGGMLVILAGAYLFFSRKKTA